MDRTLLQVIKSNCYENKIISKGNNFPSIDLSEDYYTLICVLLHNRNSIDEIKEILSISEQTLKNNLDSLLKEGLIKNESGKFLPTFLIVSEKEGGVFKELCVNVGNEIVNLILNNKEKIEKETFNITAFKQFSFEELSLFVLSDVILDFIQIDNIEQLFLKAIRPFRNNKNYYYSIMEKNKNSNKEAFEIYGNHCENIGKVAFCMYGNDRYSRLNLLTLTKENGREIFGNSFQENENYKENIVDQLIRYQIDKTILDNNIIRGLERLNLIDKGEVLFPFLNEGDFQALYDIADVIKYDLIRILNSYREKLYNVFVNSLYVEETSFEEFFIWYYHFLYSYVTEELINMNIIKRPKDGVFYYFLI